MEISQLRTLVHVAELGSLSKAAERLNIVQPALSRQIRMLEEELGMRLFDRHGRGMILTKAGQEVVKRASRVLSDLEDLKAGAVAEGSSLSGSIAIGLPPTVSELLSVPLVNSFRQRHPNVKISFVSAYSGYLLDWLQRGDIDVSILYDLRGSHTLRFVPILQEALYAVGAAGSGLHPDMALPFKRLETAPLLLPSRGHGLRDLVDRLAARQELTLDISIEANSFGTLKDLVRNGHGWTILPFAAIHSDVKAGLLSHAPLADPTPVRRLALAYRDDTSSARLARSTVHIMQDLIVDLVQRGLWAGELLDTTLEIESSYS